MMQHVHITTTNNVPTKELEELRMRTNFVAFTFANPRTEFQWEASRLFDSLLRLLPLAILQGCQQAALLELTRAVETTGLVLRHPSARRAKGADGASGGTSGVVGRTVQANALPSSSQPVS